MRIVFYVIFKSTSLKPKSNNSKNLNKHVKLNTWSTEGTWSISINTTTKVPHNKPHLIIWNHEKVVCTVIDFVS